MVPVKLRFLLIEAKVQFAFEIYYECGGSVLLFEVVSIFTPVAYKIQILETYSRQSWGNLVTVT